MILRLHHATLRVERAVGAPYAVAFADGVLRVNPSFLYMAAAFGMSSDFSATQWPGAWQATSEGAGSKALSAYY